MDDFYKDICELRKERFDNNLQKYKDSVNSGENAYLLFCCWCNAYNGFKGKNDDKTFGRYLKEKNVKLNFWQKKYIAEHYLGYKYDYSTENEKWLITKI